MPAVSGCVLLVADLINSDITLDSAVSICRRHSLMSPFRTDDGQLIDQQVAHVSAVFSHCCDYSSLRGAACSSRHAQCSGDSMPDTNCCSNVYANGASMTIDEQKSHTVQRSFQLRKIHVLFTVHLGEPAALTLHLLS